MDRRHGFLIAIALVALLVISVVFRVRVLIASGKMLLWSVAVITLVVLLWPPSRRP